MLRIRPKFTYAGLTIIMSNPSRFDDKELLQGTGGWIAKEECLRPELNIFQCDVRLVDDPSPLLPNTKVILLLGEYAHWKYTKLRTSLDENRGSPIMVNGIPCISSYSPQDTADPVDHELTKNPKYREVLEKMEAAEESDEIDAGEVFESKGRGRTARANYRFWLRNDVKKAIKILNNDGVIPAPLIPQPDYIIKPDAKFIINLLSTIKNDTFYIDIETDFVTLDIRCFSFCYETRAEQVYTVPVLDTNYLPAYNRDTICIFYALLFAVQNNIVVAHNGALFDFVVLALKYHISVGRRLFDTMVAQSRIYPTIERSLGHCMSLYTFEQYHKNEGIHGYHNEKQANQLYLYCGKDSYGMMLVKKSMEILMAKDEGLRKSVESANRAIYPYLVMSLTGMKYDDIKRQSWIKENDLLMYQYVRIMRLLMGKDMPDLISNKTCTEYFHNMLGYPVVDRSDKTGKPSLNEGNLLKLKADNPGNVVIDFLIKYRAKQKESGTLSFKPYINI